jgi:predicted nucleic acid-binding protein
MADAWDTSVASRLHGDGRHASLLEGHLRAGKPVALPAPAVQEVVHGLQRHTRHDEGFHVRLDAFTALLSHALVNVVPLGSAGAVLAGRLLALLPHPPTGRGRREGTRTRQRAAWALDVQIAACAFAGGYGILTENVADFAVLREAIARLAPGVPPLVVRDACELADAPA